MSITKRKLVKARTLAAKIVRQLGDQYWPIFDLLDQELTHRNEREERLNACLNEAQEPPQHPQ